MIQFYLGPGSTSTDAQTARPELIATIVLREVTPMVPLVGTRTR